MANDLVHDSVGKRQYLRLAIKRYEKEGDYSESDESDSTVRASEASSRTYIESEW